jgi:predicted deacylase
MTVLETAPHDPGEADLPVLPESLPGLPRLLGEAGSPAAGPTLVVVAGVHGNEPAGIAALERLFARLAAGPAPRGRVVGLAGNLAALAAGRRYLLEDLNRAWRPERLARVRTAAQGASAEERELAELDAALRAAVAEAGGRPVVVLDLHSTSGPGPAFAVLHDALRNRRLARSLPVPAVLGLEEELSGTLTDYLTESGISALSVETGQHRDPGSARRAEAAIWRVMEVAGLLPDGYEAEIQTARAELQPRLGELPRAVEVRYRHAIPAGGEFRMLPGFASFQRVRAGEPLATQDGRPVEAPFAGYLLMPLYQALGNDGFFLTRPVDPAWLLVSAGLRRLPLERILHWLPGVARAADRPGAFVVDRHVARWLVPELFHLLGFRRQERSPRYFLMERRRGDRSAS